RAIDSAYKVYYNGRLCRYEIHNINQKGNTLCLVAPYDELDARCVDLVLKTRRENADKLFDEMDRDNEQIQRKYEKAKIDSAMSNL
ncbi:MAG: hypothetical protein RRY18_06275, partial [Clostridia bacterium]